MSSAGGKSLPRVEFCDFSWRSSLNNRNWAASEGRSPAGVDDFVTEVANRGTREEDCLECGLASQSRRYRRKLIQEIHQSCWQSESRPMWLQIWIYYGGKVWAIWANCRMGERLPRDVVIWLTFRVSTNHSTFEFELLVGFGEHRPAIAALIVWSKQRHGEIGTSSGLNSWGRRLSFWAHSNQTSKFRRTGPLGRSWWLPQVAQEG